MAINLKTVDDKELLYGTKICQGCGAGMAARMALKVLGEKTVLCTPACCFAATTTVFPQSSIFVNNAISAFPGLAATASGMTHAMKAMGWDDEYTMLAIAGDGGTIDIGLQGLSGVAERNDDLIYICYDNEAYMNTGIQRSSSTPRFADATTSPVGTQSAGKPQNKKDLTEILAAHNIPYAAQTTFLGNFKDIHEKAKKAIYTEGPCFLNVLSPCPRGWRYDAKELPNICRAAVETCVWPLYEVEEGEWHLTYEPRKKLPVEEFLKMQGRFAHMFKPGNEWMIEEAQAYVDHQWEKLLAKCK